MIGTTMVSWPKSQDGETESLRFTDVCKIWQYIWKNIEAIYRLSPILTMMIGTTNQG